MNTGNKDAVWIILADASRARVFTAGFGGADPVELDGLVHERSRAKGVEILTGPPGRVRTWISGRNVTAMPPHTDPKEVEAKRFASQLAEHLRHARERGRFQFLAVAAPPHFLGLLRAKLDRHTGEQLVACVDKDFTRADVRDLRPFFEEALGTADQAASQRRAWS
jgi:hypothetical protein